MRALALFVLHLGEFDDEDGVLGRQADEHDQADLGIDVVLEAPEQKSGKGPGHGDGCAEKDRERQRPAFILGRQDQEDAEEREGEDRHRRDPLLGLLLLERHAAVVVPHLPRHGLGEDLFQRLHGLGRTVARGGSGVDLGRPVEVEAHGELRSDDVADRGERRQGDRLPLTVAHVELADILDVGPVVPLGLDEHLPLAAEPVEVVDETAPHEALQDLVDIGDVDPLLEDLVPVHVDKELRHGGEEGGGDPGQFRAAFWPLR